MSGDMYAPCPVTDLPLTMCACSKCRPDLDDLPEAAHARAVFAGGTCGWCTGPIQIGDEITLPAGEVHWQHAECAWRK